MIISNQYLFAIIIIIVNPINSNELPSLLIKFPTRERPERFFTCLDLYYKNLSGKYTYNFLITCDEDDELMNNQEVKEKLNLYPHLKVIFGISASKIDACNRDMEFAPEFNILILTSDDMNPVVYGWDEKIAKYMLEYFPDFDGILKFNDRPTHHGNLNTLPIMGIQFYRRFNYIYHPNYKSFFSDLEMTIVSRLLKKEADINEMIIQHDNYIFGGNPIDNLYQVNYKYWWPDRATFLERASKNFDLKNLTKNDLDLIAQIIKTI